MTVEMSYLQLMNLAATAHTAVTKASKHWSSYEQLRDVRVRIEQPPAGDVPVHFQIGFPCGRSQPKQQR